MNVLLALVSVVVSQAQAPRRVVYYGEGFLFRVEIPETWQANEGDKVVATVWPQGKTVEQSDASITIEAEPKPAVLSGAFEKAIDRYLTAQKTEIPGSKASVGATMETLLGQKAFAFFVEPPEGQGVRRCVAFLDTPKVAIVFLLKARTPDAYNSALAAYVPLVKSFGFVTDKVHRKTPPARP